MNQAFFSRTPPPSKAYLTLIPFFVSLRATPQTFSYQARTSESEYL